MYQLDQRTALVTGAAQRIGKAIAAALARSGMNIVAHYNSSRQEAEILKDHLRETGVQAWLVRADLTDRTEAEGLIPCATDIAGQIDVLVNNAAIFPQDNLLQCPLDAIDQSLQINALAPLVLTRRFAEQTTSGAVVNLLDTRVTSNDTAHASYTLSKKLLCDMTAMLAQDLAPGIRVNAVAPGLILPPKGEDQRYLERKQATVPLFTHGNLENVTEAVRFLLTNDFVTGQVIFVDGGSHLNRGPMVREDAE